MARGIAGNERYGNPDLQILDNAGSQATRAARSECQPPTSPGTHGEPSCDTLDVNENRIRKNRYRWRRHRRMDDCRRLWPKQSNLRAMFDPARRIRRHRHHLGVGEATIPTIHWFKPDHRSSTNGSSWRETQGQLQARHRIRRLGCTSAELLAPLWSLWFSKRRNFIPTPLAEGPASAASTTTLKITR